MLQLLGFIIDCPDPVKLAAFYSRVTGRAIMEGSGDNMAGVTFGEVDLAFQRVADYRPRRWPDDEHPKITKPRGFCRSQSPPCGFGEWGGWDSNPGPADYESAALTG
jgi:Glyoxalase-like domain